MTSQSHGGVCSIDVYDIENGITTFPDIYNQAVASAIVFAGGNDWENFVFTRWESEASEQRIELEGAEGFRFALSGRATTDTADRVQLLKAAGKKDFLVKYTNQNGQTYLIGTPEEPVSILLNSRKHGEKFSEGNILSMSFQCLNTNPFPSYDF